jgi:hypothetical protein
MVQPYERLKIVVPDGAKLVRGSAKKPAAPVVKKKKQRAVDTKSIEVLEDVKKRRLQGASLQAFKGAINMSKGLYGLVQLVSLPIRLVVVSPILFAANRMHFPRIISIIAATGLYAVTVGPVSASGLSHLAFDRDELDTAQKLELIDPEYRHPAEICSPEYGKWDKLDTSSTSFYINGYDLLVGQTGNMASHNAQKYRVALAAYEENGVPPAITLSKQMAETGLTDDIAAADGSGVKKSAFGPLQYIQDTWYNDLFGLTKADREEFNRLWEEEKALAAKEKRKARIAGQIILDAGFVTFSERTTYYKNSKKILEEGVTDLSTEAERKAYLDAQAFVSAIDNEKYSYLSKGYVKLESGGLYPKHLSDINRGRISTDTAYLLALRANNPEFLGQFYSHYIIDRLPELANLDVSKIAEKDFISMAVIMYLPHLLGDSGADHIMEGYITNPNKKITASKLASATYGQYGLRRDMTFAEVVHAVGYGPNGYAERINVRSPYTQIFAEDGGAKARNALFENLLKNPDDKINNAFAKTIAQHDSLHEGMTYKELFLAVHHMVVEEARANTSQLQSLDVFAINFGYEDIFAACDGDPARDWRTRSILINGESFFTGKMIPWANETLPKWGLEFDMDDPNKDGVSLAEELFLKFNGAQARYDRSFNEGYIVEDGEVVEVVESEDSEPTTYANLDSLNSKSVDQVAASLIDLGINQNSAQQFAVTYREDANQANDDFGWYYQNNFNGKQEELRAAVEVMKWHLPNVTDPEEAKRIRNVKAKLKDAPSLASNGSGPALAAISASYEP